MPFEKPTDPVLIQMIPVPTPVERAPPISITNKTPIYEYYGFVMYLASFVVFGLYLIWAYVPDRIFHKLGITYYPNQYWALAIPIWIMTFVWFIFVSFMSYNLMNTAPLDSYACITDDHANMMEAPLSLDNRPSDWMPELHDLPIGLVNALLYSPSNQLSVEDTEEERDALMPLRGSPKYVIHS
ncbi:PIG-P-domain-containing protein [Phycomyces nitens]|nr:PIG-P-domain-containing protein [Phycomyces nitens]